MSGKGALGIVIDFASRICVFAAKLASKLSEIHDIVLGHASLSFSLHSTEAAMVRLLKKAIKNCPHGAAHE